MINLRSQMARTVLGFFMLEDDAEVYVNELAHRFALDSGNLSRLLIALEKEGLLQSRWRGKQRYYSIDKSYPLLKEYKKIVLKTAGIEALLRENLEKIPGIDTAFIYGSYADDRMDAASDIDVMVIGRQDTLAVNKAVTKIQAKVDRAINVINMDEAEYKKKKRGDPFVRNIFKGKRIELV